MSQILIIDDHPITIMGYKTILETLETEPPIHLHSAQNCDEVIANMDKRKDSFFDIILLDINLLASTDKTVTNGEDLGFLIKKRFPCTKIIVHTGLNDTQRISNIFNTLKPEGFLIKSDIDANVLKEAIYNVLHDKNYYSKQIAHLLSPDDFEKNYVDFWNRKILLFLSEGYKMKDLPNHIPLSMATIERRKKQLKSLFKIPNESNKELLHVAKKKGFV